jgi:hypothetical protein
MAITINNFEILNNGQQLTIDVETNIGLTIQSILLWDINGFKDYSLAYNVSNLLEQVDNQEVIVVNAIDLGITKFEDIWFAEIQDDFEDLECDCATCQFPALGITYNLLPYYKCMLDYLIKTDLNSCDNCNNITDHNLTITINLLIDSIDKALDLGYYTQAIEMIKKLKKLCNIKKCNNCKTVDCVSCSQFKQAVLLGP